MRVSAPVCVLWRRVAAAATAALILGVAPQFAAASPDTPGADAAVEQDPFRRPPADLASLRPGQIIGSRAATPVLDGKAIPDTRGWQISYRSNDTDNEAIMAITTLIVPIAEWTGPGARPVVSQQFAQDSAGRQCAPSVSMSIASGNPGLFLDRNWAVAIPDHEGPRSAFMAGVSGGHIVLDGIRAVRNSGAGGIGAANPWALDGYSGGAQPTGWAAQLQPTYAPEVALKGVALGGLPADPAVVARNLDGHLFSGLMLAGLAGLSAEHPEAGIEEMLNEQGRAMLAVMRSSCVEVITSYSLRKLGDYTQAPDPIAQPGPAAALRRHALGGAAPTAPVFSYHGNLDEVIPVGQADTAIRAWCSGGTPVRIVRSPITEHISEEIVNHQAAVQYLAERFDGKPGPSDC
ncbi:lipase family protein [Nocardia sp. NPDC057272]|uniref:lipase family protein n=1 Tax=Nocardia sp. NPDC057272 TaxID=3346079 RepID=UPI00363F27DC